MSDYSDVKKIKVLDNAVEVNKLLKDWWELLELYTWAQHGTWGYDLGVPYVGLGFERDTKASVQQTDEEAPDATWSKYRTWGDTTWDKEPTCAGTCQTGTWIDLEEEAV